MTKVLYVSRSPVYDHIISSKIVVGSNLKILAPWNPSLTTRRVLNSRIFPRAFANFFLTRPKQLIEKGGLANLKIIHFGFWEFLVPILRKLNLLSIADQVNILAEQRIAKRVKIWVANSEKVIMTDDFLNVEFDFRQIELIVEIRGGTFLNVDKIRAIQRDPVDLYSNTEFSALTKMISEADNRVIQKNLDFASSFITYSEFYKSLILEKFPNKNVLLMPLSIPEYDIKVTVQESSLPRKSLLFIGRDEPIKGLDLAVNISARLNIPLHIVGNYSKPMIRNLSNVKNIKIHGRLSRGKLFSLMKSSSILLSPTIETFGYSILEAVNVGLPILTSKYAGAVEWLEEKDLVHVMEDFELQKWVNKVNEIFEEL